jgi:naphthalene 1,2-dioxygenase system ferredoxin subunit
MSDTQWEKTVSLDELRSAGGLVGYAIGEQDFAIYLVEDEVYATANLCTHGNARLSDGYLIGELIECPMHQGMFDVRTGAVMGPPCTEAIRTFPVRIDDGIISIGFASAGGASA